MGAELIHADRYTYMTNLIFAFRNFVNAPKNSQDSPTAVQKPKILRREFGNISVHLLNHAQKDMLRSCEACADGAVRCFDNLL
jgi:hypothetical protein